MSHLEPYVIRQRHPYRCLILVVIAILATLIGQWYWHHYVSSFQVTLQNENDRLTEIEEQYKQLVRVRSSQQQMQAMHEATTEQLENRLKILQQKVIDLNKELLFYQNITQGNSSSELQVRELQLRRDTDDSQVIRYRLVLTQGENISEPISGSVIMNLLSDTEEVSEQLVAEHPLNLRHVQVIEGSFQLTDEMPQPAKISIKLQQNDKTLISREFDWITVMPIGQ